MPHLSTFVIVLYCQFSSFLLLQEEIYGEWDVIGFSEAAFMVPDGHPYIGCFIYTCK